MIAHTGCASAAGPGVVLQQLKRGMEHGLRAGVWRLEPASDQLPARGVTCWRGGVIGEE